MSTDKQYSEELDTKYFKFVESRTKPSKEIAAFFSPEKASLVHAVMGISGEAGELLDTIKKTVIYGKSLDLENIVEELGDIEFYLEMMRQEIGLTREFILVKNIQKLEQRYPTTYSDKDALERKDKQQGE